VNLYPQKAINLLLEVQRKRQDVSEELQNLGIGKKFVDFDQIRKLRNLQKPPSISVITPTN